MGKPYELLFCTVEMTESSHTPLICIVVINILLAVTAFVGNLLILVALAKGCPLHPPSKLLLRSLAATDLCVGILAEPTFIVYWLSVVKKKMNFCLFVHRNTFVTGNMLCAVSILTMTTIAVERLLALTLGLRYGQVVTLKRIYVLLMIYWVFSIAGSTLHFVDYLVSLSYSYITTSLCLAISIYCYAKIFFILRKNCQNRIRDQVQPSEAYQLNIARYRKAVNSALLLQVTLVICYFPFIMVAFFTTALGISPAIYLAGNITISLVFLNSSLNPVLYCWKIKEVRNSVKETVRKLCHL
ncbi:melanocortin receptor 5-like [Montipora capricornis]|uniref:melanocortin receptor 5-like n=1 Tax=Montipora capricornis TaxID=246305 RepID=UPI0035F10839